MQGEEGVSSARAPSLPPNSLAVTSSTTDWLRRVPTKRTHSRCSPDGPSCMVRMDERARARPPSNPQPTSRSRVAALCPSCTSKLFLAAVFTKKRGVCLGKVCVRGACNTNKKEACFTRRRSLPARTESASGTPPPESPASCRWWHLTSRLLPIPTTRSLCEASAPPSLPA